MKYSYSKQELLQEIKSLVSSLCVKEEAIYKERTSKRDIKYREWKDYCDKAKDLYSKLPKDWWKNYVTTTEVSNGRLFFNETKYSENFDAFGAQNFLQKNGIDCIIERSSGIFITHLDSGARHCKPLDKISVTKVDTLRGVLESYTRSYNIKLTEDTFWYYNYQEQSDTYRDLKKILDKLESIPENVKEIILEDSDIEVIKLAKEELNDE